MKLFRANLNHDCVIETFLNYFLPHCVVYYSLLHIFPVFSFIFLHQALNGLPCMISCWRRFSLLINHVESFNDKTQHCSASIVKNWTWNVKPQNTFICAKLPRETWFMKRQSESGYDYTFSIRNWRQVELELAQLNRLSWPIKHQQTNKFLFSNWLKNLA